MVVGTGPLLFSSSLLTHHNSSQITKAEREKVGETTDTSIECFITQHRKSRRLCEIDRSVHREEKKKRKEMGKEKGLMIISISLLLIFSFSLGTNLKISSCVGSLLNLSVSGGTSAAAGGGGGGCDSSGGEKVGECLLLEEEEEEEEAKSTKRVLWDNVGGGGPYNGKRYISYEALKEDNVPCTRPGIPYYNCYALPKANPYTRGCSVITGCARGD